MWWGKTLSKDDLIEGVYGNAFDFPVNVQFVRGRSGVLRILFQNN